MLLSFSSCGPVHRFTRIKKIPREYSLNYCVGEIKAPKTDINKEPWIVFSDREKNMTYNKAGGKVKTKDIDYLDAFLVLKKKGEYLRLIKYTPDILKNGKLDYKKAEYYGWIHKSKLLLNQQSVTDVSSGKKNKMLSIFTDTASINEPQKYFVTDSIKTYKDFKFESVTGAISPYSIVYQLKKSENGSMTLVSKKPFIKADEAKQDILGWIDNSLIQDIGTGLHVNIPTIPQDEIQLITKRGVESSLTDNLKEQSSFLADQYKTIKYNPVSFYSVKDTLVAYRTRIALPVFDYSNNYIFNVNGGQISHKKYRSIAKGLKKINVTFVFEGKEQTIDQFPQLVNALQNLQPLFEQDGDLFSYRFSCVMTFDDSNKALRPIGTELNENYSQVINYLSDKANNKDKLRPLKLTRTWSGLRKAVDSFDGSTDATNLIVLIGETGYINESLDTGLMNKLLQNNCRILGFQVHAGEDNAYNNFVLDIESMINSYSNGLIKKKGDILVSPEQVRRENIYVEITGAKNGFRLDFPNRSTTQGFILFPQKGETLPMDVLSNNVDTILQQIRNDNTDIIAHMARAFASAGNNRTRYDSLFIHNFGLDSTRIPSKKLISSFTKENPGWYLPSKTILLSSSINNTVDYRLMLSELEMSELKEFLVALSSKEVDYKYQAEDKKKAKEKVCDCPDDNLFKDLEIETTRKDSIPPKYASTKKVRTHLYKQYLKTIRYCKLCKEKGSKLKNMTFSQAQFRIIGSPTSNEVLNKIKIKDIKNKKIVSDKMLDDLINYFKQKKENLEKVEKFESNGQTYYWLDRNDLP